MPLAGRSVNDTGRGGDERAERTLTGAWQGCRLRLEHSAKSLFKARIPHVRSNTCNNDSNYCHRRVRDRWDVLVVVVVVVVVVAISGAIADPTWQKRCVGDRCLLPPTPIFAKKPCGTYSRLRVLFYRLRTK